VSLVARRYFAFMLAASNKTLRSLTLSAIFGVVAAVAACSSDPAPATGCDDSKCAAGYKCLTLDGEKECRKTCSSNSESGSCPFGYTCTDTLSGESPFCVQSTAVRDDGQPLVKKPSGQWGWACQANLGFENEGCDTEQGFYCYGISPTDGDAYCTRYECTDSAECGPGFWCGQINRKPNVTTTKRSAPGDVQNVCLRRTYCATCTSDVDCPTVGGRAQHCVDVEDDGGSKACMPECDSDQACNNEAYCADVGLDAKVCYPRAKACVGDGSLCAPCRVDTDCGDDGVCVKGQYTTERTCAKKSTSSCGTRDELKRGSCPESVDLNNKAVGVACLGAVFDEVPADYCHGVYAIGGKTPSPDIGCWSPKR
jgi:hypothetical protein